MVFQCRWGCFDDTNRCVLLFQKSVSGTSSAPLLASSLSGKYTGSSSAFPLTQQTPQPRQVASGGHVTGSGDVIGCATPATGSKRSRRPHFVASPEPSPEGGYVGQHSQGIGGHYAESYLTKRRRKLWQNTVSDNLLLINMVNLWRHCCDMSTAIKHPVSYWL